MARDALRATDGTPNEIGRAKRDRLQRPTYECLITTALGGHHQTHQIFTRGRYRYLGILPERMLKYFSIPGLGAFSDAHRCTPERRILWPRHESRQGTPCRRGKW